MTGRSKRGAEARGRRAEALAAWLLRLKGYAIVARRFRCGAGEVDLVALRGRTLAFVEVKVLAGPQARLEPVSLRQQERIVRAASAFRAARPSLAGLDIRYDLVVSQPGGWPRHMRDAWRPESARLADLI
jgi:putative endonuclease